MKLARLARIKLTDAEVDRYAKEIGAILQYTEQLQAVDLDGIKPTSQVTGLVNVMRADEEINYGTTPADLLKNAPATEGNYLKVKRMIK